MYKINKIDQPNYNEAEQPNPLRWRLLYKETNGEFTDCTGQIKCRDYFNDIVAATQGHKFSVYGFDNTRVKLNDEGLYVHLEDIINSTKLAETIEKAIEPVAIEQLGEEAKLRFIITSETSGILLIPRIFFKQTYLISVLTMLIRRANVGTVFISWESLFTPFEEQWNGNTISYIRKNKFLCPKDTRDHWYYYHSTINSKTLSKGQRAPSYETHNCGVQSWLLATGYKE